MVTIKDNRPLNDISHSIKTSAPKRAFERKELLKELNA